MSQLPHDLQWLRPYQAESVQAIRQSLARHRSTLLVLPTGCGKTVVFAATAKLAAAKGRVLVLAHRQELIHQAVDKIQKFSGLSCSIEMADERDNGSSDVVVASVQTLTQPKRLNRFRPDGFVLTVVDEAHHATADSYTGILGYFDASKVLGVTATPDRLDRGPLGQVFEDVAFVYEIRDAIEQGFLVPIRQRAVEVEGLDLSRVRVSRGDLKHAELEQALMVEEVLHGMAAPIVKETREEERPTIVFAQSVAQAYALTEIINRHRSKSAAAIDGTMQRDARVSRIQDFMEGRLQYLVNCMILTEGFDAPATSCVAMCRPTKSRSLYAQCVGRGTRLSPETGKKDLLILDFKGNAGRHSLVNPMDILGGEDDHKAKDRAAKIVAREPNKDILSAYLEAQELISAEAREAELRVAVRTKSKEVDPFVVLAAPSSPGRWGGQEPTFKQLALLESAGITGEGLDKGQASALIDKILSRKDRGLSTFKQARLLIRCGLNPDISFEDANQAITAIAKNDWRVPDWMKTHPVFAAATGSEVAA